MLLKLTFDRTNNNFDDEYENFTSYPNGTFTESDNVLMFNRRSNTSSSVTLFLYFDNDIVNKYYGGVIECLHDLHSITSLTYKIIDIEDITTKEIHTKATANWDAYVNELFDKYSS